MKANDFPDGRARGIRTALDLAVLDGGVIVFSGPGVNDLLVDGGTLRDAVSVVAVWAADAGMSTLLYSDAEGVRSKDAPGGPRARVPVGVDAGTPFTVGLDVVFGSLSRGARPTVLVLPFAEGQLPDDHGGYRGDSARVVEQLAARTSDPAWRDAGHRVVLVARTDDLDRRLTRLPGVTPVMIGLPGPAERTTAFELMRGSPRHPLVVDPALPPARLARLAGGLTIDDGSRLRYRSSPTRPLAVEQILERKKEAIRAMAGNTLVVLDDPPRLESDVAGLPQIRRLVAEKQADDDNNARVLLAGPPGCGKTWVARTLAGELNVPALELGRIEGRWVGESQDNLRRAFEAIRANLPAMLIMDEIDQGVFARRGETPGDGTSVKADLRAMLFAFLGDVGDRGGLAVIGMTNRPDLLDEASSDRFTTIPVLHATCDEAAQILAIQARREGRELDVVGAAAALAATGEVFSGRRLVRLLDSAGTRARECGHARIEDDDVAWALRDAREGVGPGAERMALLAVAATSYNRHLPWNAARHLGAVEARPPKYLDPFVLGDGTVDAVALEARIRELDHDVH